MASSPPRSRHDEIAPDYFIESLDLAFVSAVEIGEEWLTVEVTESLTPTSEPPRRGQTLLLGLRSCGNDVYEFEEMREILDVSDTGIQVEPVTRFYAVGERLRRLPQRYHDDDSARRYHQPHPANDPSRVSRRLGGILP